MRVRHRRNGAERAVELVAELDGLTVADLAAALGVERQPTSGGVPAAGVSIDGCWHPPDTPLASVQIWEGALLEVSVDGEPAPAQTATTRDGRPKRRSVIAVTGGIRAGDSMLAPSAGAWTIGRDVGCDLMLDDPSVSNMHARLFFERTGRAPVIADLRSRNGTILAGRPVSQPERISADATVRVGATSLQWRAVFDDAPTAIRAGLGTRDGRVPFNRPPRRSPPVASKPITVPSQAPPPAAVEPLSKVGIVLPLAMGLVLALVWNPLMAVFAVLGPAIAVGTWLERRRRARRVHQASSRQLADKTARLKAELPQARSAERHRILELVPDLAEVVRRAETPSVRCWQRRLSDPDAMRLGVGTADVAYTPPLRVSGDGPAAPEALEAIRSLGPLEDLPVSVSLAAGSVVGIVGADAVSRAVARSLVLQAAVFHGPADLAIAAVSTRDASAWAWMRWLPHTADLVSGEPGGLVACADKSMADVAEASAAVTSQRMLLAIVEGVDALAGRGASGRALLTRRHTAGIVVVPEISDLPSVCTTIVEVVHEAGGLRLLDPRSAVALEPVIAWGVSTSTANQAAARLARLEDPELGAASARLPDAVPLIDLLGVEVSAEAVQRRWDERRDGAAFRTPIGTAADGALELDLVTDGPHLLIGGTTGSGKSELLRSLIAGLAMSACPDDLAFVLIDYKGGAAFDRCADMPHTAGMVTDLDERLAERALTCLEAELRYREERLRSVGAEDLTAFRDRFAGEARSDGRLDPLPRLLVAVDEFATLAAELPEFLNSLVGIAQRGRSLGVHMVLATQRPAGVVTEDIRANTSCRIALRVTDRQDSSDVIGSPEAAKIPRRRPGRALARFGPGELIAFQSALVTATTPRALSGLRIRESIPASSDQFESAPAGVDGSVEPAALSGRGDASVTRSDLECIVEAVSEAHRRRGGMAPRSPWPAPLPSDLGLEELAARAAPGEPAVWLVDDPCDQRQFSGGWHDRDGNLAVIGGPASGKSTTLAALALDLCRRRSADDLHVYAIDLDSGRLAALRTLPHVGAVIAPADTERRERLLRMLDEEVSARRRAVEGRDGDADSGAANAQSAVAGHRDNPRIVLLVDDLAGLARSHDPIRDSVPHERLARIWSDGPAVGVRLAASAGRAADLPPDLAASAGLVLMHASSDAGEGLRFGVRASTVGLPAGRAIRVDDGREAQIARPRAGDFTAACDAMAAAARPPRKKPAAVGSLPPVVAAGSLPVCATANDRSIELSFAMGDLTLAPAGFALHDGEHAVILGPARSGRTGTLAAIGAAARTAGVPVEVVAGPLGDLAPRLAIEVSDPKSVEEDCEDGARRLVLIDDADGIDDPDGVLARLARARGARWHVVAAASAERLRSSYGHWLHEMRTCRTGVLLRPGPLDGDMLGATLPPRLALPPTPGRGLIVANGVALAAQMAMVDPA